MIPALFLSAALGGMLRFLLSKTGPYVETFIANMAACVVLAAVRDASPLVMAAVGTGFAGALSTWSTLAKELGTLIRQRRWKMLLGYATATILGGMVAVWCGFQI